jgi:autotransporter-associated beta strand protein/T5SS/PEP-CTERM-associated repeat protein
MKRCWIAGWVLCLSLATSYSASNFWTGNVSSDWNNTENWSPQFVPDGAENENAVINNGASGYIATISADISAIPNAIEVTAGSRIDHQAGVAGNAVGFYMAVGMDGAPSFYNLADTRTVGTGISGYAQGSGSLNATGNLYVGADAINRAGTLRVNTSGALVVSNELFIGDSQNSTGNFLLESGTMTVNNKIYVGRNSGNGTVGQSGGTISANSDFYIGNEKFATGTYTLSGTGALNVANEVVVGRETGMGTLNVNGGTITTTGDGGNLYVGRRNGSGTLNQSNGVIIVNREFGVGTRDENKSGTGFYNLGGGSLTALSIIFIGKEQGASGTMKMAGGTVNGRDKLIIGDNGASGYLSQSDGTVTVQYELYIGNGPSQAPVSSILANSNDGRLEKRSDWATAIIQDVDDWNVNIGEWYGNTGLTTAVIPFQLPNFGEVTNPFTSANFGVNLYQKGNATVTDLDLYAVRLNPSPQIATTDWYNGSAPDPNATLIQASFLTPASTVTSVGSSSGPNNLTDTAGSAALLSYLNSAYNGGVGAGQFVFLRVSYSSNNFPSGWDAYNFTTRNAAQEGDAPVINFTSAVPPLPPAGSYTLSGTGALNVANEVIVGRDNGTGILNVDGGTITKTGDGKFLVGHNNGVGTVVQSGGTISANNELYIGNQNSGARGTYTLSGTGALNVANEVVVGRESGTGILNVDGGTITTTGDGGHMYVGRLNGTGTLNQTAGTISVNREFGVGTRDGNQGGIGTYNLSDTGAITVANNIFIGKEQGASGTMTMTGGTMTGSDKLILGHNQATGALTQSGGTVNVQNEVYIGNENSASSVGAYTLSGTGVLNVGNEVQVGRDNGTGTFNLNGGTVNATKISGGNGSATVNFNGGVIKAKRDESNLIENLDVANVQSGGLKIDSNGFNVSTGQVLTGTGGLEKSGAGQLTLSGANTYAGTTTVAAGALRIEKSGLVAIVDATTNAIEAQFTPQPAPGDYPILPGSLAGTQAFSATGLGANQQATFDRSTSTVTVTGELVTGSTFASLYPANSEATLGSNGLSNLMNYALGGVGESSIPALPQLTVGVNGLTLTGNVRTDDTGLTIRGETATSLSGPWTPVDLSATGAPSAVLNTTVKSSTVPIDPAEPKKFLRFHVTK